MKNTYSGPATIFRHDKNGRTFYSVPVSRKNSEGGTEFAYKLVQFKKGIDIADRSRIDIRNAWETFYINKDGEAVFYVFISDFTMEQPQQPAQYQPPQYQRPPQQTQRDMQIAAAATAPNRQPAPGFMRQQMAVGPGGYRQAYGQPPQAQQPQETMEQIDDDVPF